MLTIIKEALNKSSAVGRRIFCPIRAVLKLGKHTESRSRRLKDCVQRRLCFVCAPPINERLKETLREMLKEGQECIRI